MAAGVWRADVLVVILRVGSIGPKVAGADRLSPIGGWRHSVRSIEHTDDKMTADWRCAIALDLVRAQPAAPN
ncbi:hypothetical protein PhaeoP72_03421 [Phaeobacter inhibens]|nr:hypothetical protein PhaeoP92_03323 [Phaeobacter inhibens]AUQ79965.1 hypothetical protein PhaeoP74_03324 [Phaeobacter inhibens]AUR05348.1 hypothetical protein PhaeoP72_03421 [Phaeobacter inhibens]AUR17124.1 hypothetical protein PhaeoP70_03322 [Phaeobacter inhibens]